MKLPPLPFLYPLLLLLSCFLPSAKAHLVFEEIGAMVGSVSYLHCAIAINLTSVDDMISNATTGIKVWAARVEEVYRQRIAKGQDYAYHFPGSLDKRDLVAQQELASFMEESIAQLGLQVADLKMTLPRPDIRSTRSIPGDILRAGSKLASGLAMTPSFFLSLVQGIFGTFMGLYTHRQLNKLKEELGTVEEVQQRVIGVVKQHDARIHRVETELAYLHQQAAIHTAIQAPLAVAKIDRIRAEIQHSIQTIVHAAQAAQQHRLAVDLLSPTELTNLYKQVQLRADLLGYKLLTSRATDLFQVEVSYMFDGSTLMLLLHVPMVPKKAYLALYRLHPFPIPFSEDRALMPKPTTDILAISFESPRLTTTINLIDLANCHRINHVYICERHGVLHRNTRTTCLGALFENDLELAQVVCELELVPYEEYALHLENNWFLVHSLKMYTSFAHCQNGSVFEKQVMRGVSKIYIDPACSMELQTLVLFSDISLQLDTSTKHFEWSQADLAVFGVTNDDITATLEDFGTVLTEQELLLSEVKTHQKMRARVPWIWVWALVASVAGLGLLLVLYSGINTTQVLRLQRLVQLLPAQLRRANDEPMAEEVELQNL